LVAPELWYRLGSAQDQHVLEANKNTYQGFVVPAHILAWGRSWVTGLLTRTAKPFLIDPMTYIFSQSSDLIKGEKEVKKSYEALLKFYGHNFSKIIQRRSVRSSDFVDKSGSATPLLKEFVSKVIDLQLEVQRAKSPTQASLGKYRRMLGETASPGDLQPAALIAPYFHFTDGDDPWVAVNEQLFKETLRHKEGIETYVFIAASPGWLRVADWGGTVRAFKGSAGFILWISAQSEAKLGVPELASLKRAVKGLSAERAKVHLMHAGYYSLCLGVVGAKRVSSGIGFGESREITAKPTGGGFPSRYYLRLLKRQQVVTNIRTLLSDQPSLLCDCSVCSAALKSTGVKPRAKPKPEQIAAFFDQLDDDALKTHFLLNRFQESRRIGNSDLRQLDEELTKSIEMAEKLKVDNYGLSYRHLETWSQALRSS